MAETTSPIPLLGSALVSRNLLTPEALQEALARARSIPHLSFKQIITVFYHISMPELDLVEYRDVIVPRLTPLLLQQLQDIAKRDRFSGGLDVRQYVVEVDCLLERCIAQSTERRLYHEGERSGPASAEITRFDQTENDLRVSLRTADGQTVVGRIKLRYNSLERKPRIMDEENELKHALYYGLRQAFREAARK